MANLDSETSLLQILSIATAISSASNLKSLLDLILRNARDLTHADAGSIFLIERAAPPRFGSPEAQDPNREGKEQDKLWFAVSQNSSIEARRPRHQKPPTVHEGQSIEEDLHDVRFPITSKSLAGSVALKGKTLNLKDAYSIPSRADYHFDCEIDKKLNYRAVSILTVPMLSAEHSVIGVLQLINRKNDPELVITPENALTVTRSFDDQDIQLIEALASLAAVCVERTQLAENQEKLLDSMITLMAGAIDAKSPYTGGHCNRVPELAFLLAKEAEKATDGPFADFKFPTEMAWREFRIGALLHDCGKVTTPQYVVDKATKLEAKWNRIHEIRTRFEVLLRDAKIESLNKTIDGLDSYSAEKLFAEREKELKEQFKFVAESNLGNEFFDEESIERLQKIGKQSWKRHFDDTLGLAWEEHQRRTELDPQGTELPASETLLSDKPWHRIRRTKLIENMKGYGFHFDPPEDEFNLGELHNLAVSRGTLTNEERFKINDHIVQTIIMLERLPFPPNLSRVAEYAGTHHETLRGDGYPRKLNAEQLSIPARIMAIADIFEALTAADRPYKKAKSLSESVKILSKFRDDGHIDSDLFELFLSSGTYKCYADRYLKPEQIDDVDISQYLSNLARQN